MNFKCVVCEKTYSNRSNLIRHVKLHQNLASEIMYCDEKANKNFKCVEDKCGISFYQNNDLIRHLSEKHYFKFDEESHEFNCLSGK